MSGTLNIGVKSGWCRDKQRRKSPWRSPGAASLQTVIFTVGSKGIKVRMTHNGGATSTACNFSTPTWTKVEGKTKSMTICCSRTGLPGCLNTWARMINGSTAERNKRVHTISPPGSWLRRKRWWFVWLERWRGRARVIKSHCYVTEEVIYRQSQRECGDGGRDCRAPNCNQFKIQTKLEGRSAPHVRSDALIGCRL